MTATQSKMFRPVYWRDGKVVLIDQTRLPQEEVWLEFSEYPAIVDAIRDMRIRGAPAIGIAGAYAMALAAREAAEHDREPKKWLDSAAEQIRSARPTAVNLAWAVERMLEAARGVDAPSVPSVLAAEAVAIQEADEEANRSMGKHGARLFPPGSRVLTHCNTGALATGGYGTALGLIRTAWDQGRVERVFATETRPLLQGARLTAWELASAGIDATLIADSAAGHLMSRGDVDAVIVGADRIAANGAAGRWEEATGPSSGRGPGVRGGRGRVEARARSSDVGVAEVLVSVDAPVTAAILRGQPFQELFVLRGR